MIIVHETDMECSYDSDDGDVCMLLTHWRLLHKSNSIHQIKQIMTNNTNNNNYTTTCVLTCVPENPINGKWTWNQVQCWPKYTLRLIHKCDELLWCRNRKSSAKIMAADVLATQGARPSATMILTIQNERYLSSTRNECNYPQHPSVKNDANLFSMVFQ